MNQHVKELKQQLDSLELDNYHTVIALAHILIDNCEIKHPDAAVKIYKMKKIVAEIYRVSHGHPVSDEHLCNDMTKFAMENISAIHHQTVLHEVRTKMEAEDSPLLPFVNFISDLLSDVRAERAEEDYQRRRTDRNRHREPVPQI